MLFVLGHSLSVHKIYFVSKFSVMPFFLNEPGYTPRRIVRAKRPSRKTRLNRQLALRTPEVKDCVVQRTIAQLDNNAITSAPIFENILQGSAGNQRVGDRIRVLSIEVAGRAMGDVNNSTFTFVCPKIATRTPLLTDFTGTTGTLYDLSRGWVLMHFVRDSGSLNCLQTMKKTFPKGMLVTYDPDVGETTQVVTENEVYATNVNRTGVNVTNISYSIRIRYVDA